MPSISNAGCFFKVFGYYYDFKKFVHLFVYPLHIDYIYVNLNILCDSLHIRHTHTYIYIIKLYIHNVYLCSLVHPTNPPFKTIELQLIWHQNNKNMILQLWTTRTWFCSCEAFWYRPCRVDNGVEFLDPQLAGAFQQPMVTWQNVWLLMEGKHAQTWWFGGSGQGWIGICVE